MVSVMCCAVYLSKFVTPLPGVTSVSTLLIERRVS